MRLALERLPDLLFVSRDHHGRMRLAHIVVAMLRACQYGRQEGKSEDQAQTAEGEREPRLKVKAHGTKIGERAAGKPAAEATGDGVRPNR